MVWFLDALLGLVALALAWRLWRVWRTRPTAVRPAWWTDPDDVGRTPRAHKPRRPFRRGITELPVSTIRQFGDEKAGGVPLDELPGHVNGHDRYPHPPLPRPRGPRW